MIQRTAVLAPLNKALARRQLLHSQPHGEALFWATHQGAEIDLVLRRGSDLFGIEYKRTDQPRLTPSIKSALADLGLKRVIVIYPGVQRYPLADRVEAAPLQAIAGAGSLSEGGEK